MINIDFDAVGNWAERRNLPYAGYTDLAQKPEVYQLIRNAWKRSTPTWPPTNAGRQPGQPLPGAAQGAGRRRRRADPHQQGPPRLHREKYQPLVDALYGGKTEQYIETQVKFEDGRTGSVSATLKISWMRRPSRRSRRRRLKE
jgi:long-chain acyl-CoA synthetase